MYHPDSPNHKGNEKVKQQMLQKFLKIKEAYDLLMYQIEQQ